MHGRSEIPPIPERFESLVLQVLSEQPAISEYRLMQYLSSNGFIEFKPDLEPLAMFRAHFLLFHLLYRLQDRWLAEGRGRLSIHVTEIHLEEMVSPSHAATNSQSELLKNDSVKAYYLDYNEFLSTQEEDVHSLLDEFWQRMAEHPLQSADSNTRLKALQTLELEGQSLSVERVKQQFRSLCQQHHPDKGGDPQRFRSICDAKDILVMSLKGAYD